MNRDKIIKLAEDLYFKPKEEVIQIVLDESKKMKEKMEFLSQFDTENVAPMDRVNQNVLPSKYLNFADPVQVNYREILFKNSVHSQNKNIVIKKVIND
ncbi:hypothetical protein [Mesomycoplasma bovoculi]|uniref:Asp-tRNAAsn/Glu-tRNAGln amidotransferase C subunit n=1 Tax=Mesomycoplasma bovoculi M165/69 TaxID=743966 RepID=W5USK2_9BACT|nr:hypothetical protein [Mesomycoplasma bovoculi]AHH45112.1 asp-tRNAAsn/Glu-tRNAGln amidotransferase C subunit [Mesomycoplasma bovoculi M165/69]